MDHDQEKRESVFLKGTRKRKGPNWVQAVFIFLISVSMFFFFALGFKSIVTFDYYNIIDYFFVLIGFYGGFYILKFFKNLLVKIIGDEEIEITDKVLFYKNHHLSLSISKVIHKDQINGINVISLNESDLIQFWSNKFERIKYGVIVLNYGSKRKLRFGHTLDKDQIEEFYNNLGRSSNFKRETNPWTD